MNRKNDLLKQPLDAILGGDCPSELDHRAAEDVQPLSSAVSFAR